MLKKVFGDRAFIGLTLKLALPVALQNMLLSSFALVDMFMVGSLGDTALAAIGMAGQISTILATVLYGFNSGAAVFIAQYWGVSDIRGIRRTYGLAAISSASAALLFALAALCCPELVLSLFTRDAEVIAEGVRYLHIAGFSYVAVALSQICSTVLRSTEIVKLPLYASIGSVLLNAALNALCIYVLDMGVAGAAVGTVASAWGGLAILLFISWKKKNILFSPLKEMLDWGRGFVPHFVRVSLPTLLNEALWGFGTVFCRAIYSNASTEFYAGLTAFFTLEGLVFSFCAGVGHACGVLVGKDVGAGRYKDAIDKSRRYIFYTVILGVCMCCAVLLMRPLIPIFFPKISQLAISMAQAVMVVYALEMILRYIPYITICGTFRSGGDTRFGLFADIGCLWGLAVPTTLLCVNVLHMDLVYATLCMLLAEDLIKTAICLWYWKTNRWIRPVTG